MANVNFPEVEKVLKDGGRILAESIAAEAVQKGVYNTGQMARSFRPLPLSEQQGKFQLKIEALEYASYQDEGVQGAVSSKNIGGNSRFRFKNTTKYISPDSGLGWKARKTIAERGIRPRPFIQAGADRVIDGYFAPQLENAGVTDIENIVTRGIETQYTKVK